MSHGSDDIMRLVLVCCMAAVLVLFTPNVGDLEEF